MIDRKNFANATFLKEYRGPCPSCGYRLIKPESNRCPECGSRLRVALVAPFRLTPWHAMVVSMAISIGVILDRVALTAVGISSSNSASGAWKMFWFSVIPLAVLGVCFYVVWTQKKRLNSVHRWKRISWYVAACMLPLVVVAAQLFGLIWFALRA